MARILFIMTGSDHWTLNDGTTTPTGYWAEEAIVPLQAFEAASHEVVVATPGGIKSRSIPPRCASRTGITTAGSTPPAPRSTTRCPSTRSAPRTSMPFTSPAGTVPWRTSPSTPSAEPC